MCELHAVVKACTCRPRRTVCVFGFRARGSWWWQTRPRRNKFSNHFRRMSGVLSHVEDCQGQHYFLQLNIYKSRLPDART
jgi:hypothetical protein